MQVNLVRMPSQSATMRRSWKLRSFFFRAITDMHHLQVMSFSPLWEARTANMLPAQPIPYLHEELNHFQDFTHFLDSIGLPSEWVPAFGDMAQIQNPVSTEQPEFSRSSGEQHESSSRPRQSERSRADSPFRSWLPSVPPGDQSFASVSDYGMSI